MSHYVFRFDDGSYLGDGNYVVPELGKAHVFTRRATATTNGEYHVRYPYGTPSKNGEAIPVKLEQLG